MVQYSFQYLISTRHGHLKTYIFGLICSFDITNLPNPQPLFRRMNWQSKSNMN